jgi:hypothetical protein
VNVRVLSAAALLAAASCAAPTAADLAAARRGADDAARDLARGRPRVAFIGRLTDDASALDPSTGRVRFSAGCCPTSETVAYRDAYDDAVRAAPGLAAAALAAKATTRAAMDAALAGEDAKEIRLGGPDATSPDGRFRIEIAPGEGRDAIALWCRDASTGGRDELRYLGSERAIVAFGDGGTTLFVRDDAAHASSTYDLPAALFLQVFPDPGRER